MFEMLEKWDLIKEAVRKEYELSDVSFNTWVKPLKLLSVEGNDVHDMNFREMTEEQLREESLIDLAYAILQDRKSAINFNDLIAEIKSYKGMSDGELKQRLVQFYTDLNVEGRFLLNHENGWGLREWYKIETIEEETAPTVKTRKKKKAVIEDEEDEIVDLDEGAVRS